MPSEAWHEDHFGTAARQKEAATLGIWVFLGTEVLFFGGLLVAYAEYRWLFTDAFHAAGRHIEAWLGLVLTFVLISSSLVASFAVSAVRKDRPLVAAAFLSLTILLGLTFLGLHLWEWIHHLHEGLGPGEFFQTREPDLHVEGASLFYTLYYLTTGLHILHVTVGLGVLSVITWRTATLRYDSKYDNPLEVAVTYWHFVDLVWTFLFPLFYLCR